MVRIHVHVRILRYGLWALICLNLLNRGVRPKAMVPTISPFFPAREISLPWLEKYRILNMLIVGNGALLMLVCSNVRISEGFSIFGNTFIAGFWSFPQVHNPYKRL